MQLRNLSTKIGKLLRKKKLSLAICESCTGGMLGSVITSIPGSSKYFSGGIIAYSNDAKTGIVGVREDTLKKYGAVSAEVAVEMAKGVHKKLKSDIGIGITGIAGPTGSSKKKPVGLVYIAISQRRKITVKCFLFKGNRDAIRKKACKEALFLLNSSI